MPRAKAVEKDTTETKPKKAAVRKPRARAATKTTKTTTAKPKTTRTRKPTAKKPAAKRAATVTRTRTARKKPEPIEEIEDRLDLEEEIMETPRSASRRKAPTAFAAEKSASKAKRAQYIVVASLMVVGIGASAVVGFADSSAGQINVTKTIEARNERMANMVDVDGPVTVAAAPSTAPDGGLIGGQPSTPKAPPLKTAAELDQATSTATSTASSTDSAVAGVATSTAATDETIPESSPEDFITRTATTTVTATSSDPAETVGE